MISKRLTAMYTVLILIGAVFPGIWGSGGIPLAEASDLSPSFRGGNGTAIDPYTIENALGLQAIGEDLTAYYTLKNDIDASVTKGWNSGKGFGPIGTDSNSFTGNLDGSGFNITNLYISRSSTNFVGLFGAIGT